MLTINETAHERTAAELIEDIRRGLKEVRLRTGSNTREMTDTGAIMRHDLKRALTLPHRKTSDAEAEAVLGILALELEHNRKELNWPDDSKSLQKLVVSTLKHGAIAGELRERFPAISQESLREAMYGRDNPGLFLEVQSGRIGSEHKSRAGRDAASGTTSTGRTR